MVKKSSHGRALSQVDSQPTTEYTPTENTQPPPIQQHIQSPAHQVNMATVVKVGMLEVKTLEQENTIVGQRNTLSEQGKKIVELEVMVTDQGKSIVAQGKKIVAQGKTTIEQRNTISEQGKKIVELEVMVTDQGKSIVAQGKKIVEQRNTISEQGKKIVELEVTIDEMKVENVTQQKNMETKYDTLLSMVNGLTSKTQKLEDYNQYLTNERINIENELILGELAIQLEKAVCKDMKIKSHTFAELERANITSWDTSKAQFGLDDRVLRAVIRLKDLRLNAAHPHVINGSPITKSVIMEVAPKYSRICSVETIEKMVDLLSSFNGPSNLYQ
ncbi:hypothetical protein DFA_00204 [Cavenderia fasciculata]|uniref:Uncharacterized protein n=1 Tax=Cavenderia fasciculata TaxID=261658 RepID=F4PXW6_CACFS|nr:uncharacterized protein DFA_00204 [Cavenderia fasciculata]EGG19626.1 hypothetical protein DFA_00204 [Cavenderia fasciculata]|eukprot:XP_004357920.1 hypothetical protein DFA_00204 [Cavenderia fasciculata]